MKIKKKIITLSFMVAVIVSMCMSTNVVNAADTDNNQGATNGGQVTTNGIISFTEESSTPEPKPKPKPEPKPEPKPKPILPQTGEASANTQFFGGLLFISFILLFFWKTRREHTEV